MSFLLGTNKNIGRACSNFCRAQIFSELHVDLPIYLWTLAMDLCLCAVFPDHIYTHETEAEYFSEHKKRVVKCEDHQDVVALWMRMNFALNTLRPRQDGRHFPEDILKCIFLNENISISINISLKFVPKGRINNNPALVQIMAWRRSGDKPLPEPMVVRILTHICVTRPQWVKMMMYCYLLHLLPSTKMDI